MAPRAARSVDGSTDEAFRTLRSTVKFAASEHQLKSVLVVDVDRTQTSNVASRLAQAFAQAGDSCALIETDLRNVAGNRPGFSDLVKGMSLERVAPPSESGGLVCIPAGTVRDVDVLAGDCLTAAIAALEERFAHLIFSCASLPEHADALALAPRIDTTILVISAGKTRRPRAIDARDQLERVGAHILGVVMVDAARKRFS